MSGEFDGLVVLVTGGASGIGRSAAEVFVARGARVACLDVNTDGVPASALAVHADVSDDGAVKAAVAKVVEQLGGIDIVVNNAGIGAQGTVAGNDDEEWHRTFDVNVVGAVRVSRAALPHLCRSEHAAIVNTCSVAATAGLPNRALYSATKGALLAFDARYGRDHIADGIRVNCVTPGTAETPWISRLLDGAREPAVARAALEDRQPLGRLVSADEVAHAIAYLASPLSASTTGTVLAVDGGMFGLRVPAVHKKASQTVS